jgi:hypothetical protein
VPEASGRLLRPTRSAPSSTGARTTTRSGPTAAWTTGPRTPSPSSGERPSSPRESQSNCSSIGEKVRAMPGATAPGIFFGLVLTRVKPRRGASSAIDFLQICLGVSSVTVPKRHPQDSGSGQVSKPCATRGLVGSDEALDGWFVD